MSLFLNLVPYSTALRLWDFIFTRGSASTVLITLGILKYFSDDLLKIEEFSAINNFLQNSCKNLYHWNKLIDVINSSHVPKISEINELRKITKAQIDESNKKRCIAELSKTPFGLEELEEMYNSFMSLPSASVNDTLTFDDFFKFLHKWPIGQLVEKDGEYKKAIVDYFDTNKDGSISFKEYCIGISGLVKGTPEEKIRLAFKIYDTNNSGTIEKQEMVSYLESQYRVFKEDISYTMATYSTEEIFNTYDTDHNGVLSFDEFKMACESEALLMRLLQL